MRFGLFGGAAAITASSAAIPGRRAAANPESIFQGLCVYGFRVRPAAARNDDGFTA
jgi:hypothetical protein